MTDDAKRIETERKIIARYLETLVAKGCKLSLLTDETTIRRTRNWKRILEEVCAVDDERVEVHLPDGKNSFVYFVMGNAPGEVLNDCGTNVEPFIAEVDSWAERWA